MGFARVCALLQNVIEQGQKPPARMHFFCVQLRCFASKIVPTVEKNRRKIRVAYLARRLPLFH